MCIQSAVSGRPCFSQCHIPPLALDASEPVTRKLACHPVLDSREVNLFSLQFLKNNKDVSHKFGASEPHSHTTVSLNMFLGLKNEKSKSIKR